MKSIEDRLIEDPEFYVKVQKSKIIAIIVLGLIAGLLRWIS